MTALFFNAIVGLLIGLLSASWFEVLLACVGCGGVNWLMVAPIARRGTYKPRFIIWWSISFVPSLIVANLTYIVRAVAPS
jgi:hypothetical protein